MTHATKPIPEGFHTITPGLVVRNVPQAIDFYKKALGAEERTRMNGPDGHTIMHAELKIGDSIFFLSEESPERNIKSPQTLGGCTVTLNLYVPNVDELFKQAIAAGGKEAMPIAETFWAHRFGMCTDRFGIPWMVNCEKKA